jgi:hypothetical protein
MLVIPALKRLRQEGYEFKASLDHIVISIFKKKKKRRRRRKRDKLWSQWV